MIKIRIALMISCLLPFIASPAIASDIGRATIGGKEIILDADGTWKYAPLNNATATVACSGSPIQSGKLKVSMCLPQIWTINPNASAPFEYEFGDHTKDIYAGIITERTLMSSDLLDTAILTNAAGAMNITVNDMPIRRRAVVQLNGKEWHYLEFEADLKGSKFIMANYHQAFNEGGAAQVLFWTSEPFFDESRPEIEAVAATLTTQLTPSR